MIRSVMFDFGGVITDSPFDAFESYELAEGLPVGTIRTINSTNPHDNAWAQLERGDVGMSEFCDLFEAEALTAGYRVDARAVMAGLAGKVRPGMVEAVRRCSERFKTACLTNNFVLDAGSRSGHGPPRDRRDPRLVRPGARVVQGGCAQARSSLLRDGL